MTASQVECSPHGFLLAGQRVPFLSGAVHYWRLDRSSWGRCLDRVAELGLPIVESYVPWGVHELARGSFDFGEHNRQLDLSAFLEACRARDLKVILRPGPHSNAELTYFGFPARVLNNPACQARTARNTIALQPAPPRSFPIPSYAQVAFLEEVDTWFAAFAARVAPYLGELVISVQVDNEMGYFFRTSPFDLDYSEGSIALFRRFLRTRYKKENELATMHGPGSKFDTVDPPRRFEATRPEDLPRYLDWAAFHRFYTVESLRFLRGSLENHGVRGVPLFHNLPPAEVGPPFDIPGIEAHLDFAGLDLYHRRQEYAVVKRRVQAVAGSSRLPVSPECGVGGWLAWQSFTAKDNLETLLAALMHGLKGVNLYMLVERERWYGSPIGREGRAREPLYGWLQKLIAALHEVKLYELTREAPIGVLLPNEYADLASVASAVAPLTPLAFGLFGLTTSDLAREDRFGLRHAVQTEGPQLAEQWRAALDRAGLPHVIVASNAAPELLSARRVLLVPTLDFLDEALAARLLAYAERGGVVVVGPDLPDLNTRLLPGIELAEVGVQLASRRGEAKAGGRAVAVTVGQGAFWRVDPEVFAQPEGLDVVLGALSGALSLRTSLQIKGAESSVFRNEAGQARALFVASAGEAPCVAEISGEDLGTLLDPLSGESWRAESGVYRVPVDAWTVRLLVARPA